MPTPTSADGGSADQRVAEDLEDADLAAAAPGPGRPRSRSSRAPPSSAARASSGPGSPPDRRWAASPRTAPAPPGPAVPRGTAAGRTGCPTGPDQLPDWIPETRSGGVWSPGHHTGWSTGTSRVSDDAVQAHARGGAGARAPGRQVVREPNRGVECCAGEVVVDHRPLGHAVTVGRSAPVRNQWPIAVVLLLGGARTHVFCRSGRHEPLGAGPDVHRMPGAGRQDASCCGSSRARDPTASRPSSPIRTARLPVEVRTCTPRPRVTTSRCAGELRPGPSARTGTCQRTGGRLPLAARQRKH